MIVYFAYAIIVLLVIFFFITYIINKKTPLPEGCEEEVCASCSNMMCNRSLKKE